MNGQIPGTIGILGAGAAGRALAVACAHALPASTLRVWARREESLGNLPTGTRTSTDLPGMAACELLLFAISDPAISEVAGALKGALKEPTVALHLAGSLGPEVLESLADQGVETGVFHPLLALGPTTGPAAWSGALCSLAGTPRARAMGEQLSRAFGAEAIELAPQHRVRYHAAAALVAQGAVALVQTARKEWAEAGIDPERGRRGLASLLGSVAANLASGEPHEVLTGPIARDDQDTIAAHRKVSGTDSTEFQDLILRVLQSMLRG